MKNQKKNNLHSIPVEKLFLFIAVFFGLLSIFLLPILEAPDESSHFVSSEGTFRSGTNVPDDLLIAVQGVRQAREEGTYASLFTQKVDFEGSHFGISIRKDLIFKTANDSISISGVSEIAHLPQALGILLGKCIYPSIGVMVICGRLFNLAVYVIGLYFIIKRVKYAKLAFFFVALIPMMIQQAGSLSYDVVNILVIMAFMAFMINLYTQKDAMKRKQIGMLLFLSLLLCITKQSNIVLLLFLPFLPKNLYRTFAPFSWIEEKTSLKQRRVFKVIVVVVVCLGVLFVEWKMLAHYNETPIHLFKMFIYTFLTPNVNYLLDVVYTTGIFGTFGWLQYWFPEWFILIECAVLLLILLSEKIPQISKRFAIISGMVFVFSFLLITMGMYFLWTLRPDIGGESASFIMGLQGRYFTPLLVLLIPVFAYLQKYVKVQSKHIVPIAVIMTTGALAYYLILTIMFFY